MGIIKRAINFAEGVKLSDLPAKVVERNKKKHQLEKLKTERAEKIRQIEISAGVDFGGYVKNDEAVGVETGTANDYEPSYDMPVIMDYLKVTPEDSFIDLGCGKGWAMQMFSTFPFKRIDGVELNKKLSDIAENNFKTIYGDNDRFHIFNENVFDFKYLDDYNYIYMYNPFPREVFPDVAKLLKESAKRQGRKVTVIYQNPQKGSLIEDDGTFKRIMFADASALYESN